MHKLRGVGRQSEYIIMDSDAKAREARRASLLLNTLRLTLGG
jgi:hypothetical protein